MAAWRELRGTMQEMAQAMQQMVHGQQQIAQEQLALGQLVQPRSGSGDLHRNFRGMNPPQFAGTTDPDEAENWMQALDQIFEVMQCSDAEKVLLAVFQLEKEARSWWDATKVTIPGDQITWDVFQEQFNNRYFSKRIREKKAAEFAALKQRSLSVAEYEAKFEVGS